MWIPMELINYIMEYNGSEIALMYDKKYGYKFKINILNDKYNCINNIYKTIIFNSEEIEGERQTQVYYEISTPKKFWIPRVFERMVTVKNNMFITLREMKGEVVRFYTTSLVMTMDNNNSLLLN